MKLYLPNIVFSVFTNVFWSTWTTLKKWIKPMVVLLSWKTKKKFPFRCAKWKIWSGCWKSYSPTPPSASWRRGERKTWLLFKFILIAPCYTDYVIMGFFTNPGIPARPCPTEHSGGYVRDWHDETYRASAVNMKKLSQKSEHKILIAAAEPQNICSTINYTLTKRCIHDVTWSHTVNKRKT